MKKLSNKEIINMKIASMEEEIIKLKKTIQRLEIGLELNGLEIRNI